MWARRHRAEERLELDHVLVAVPDDDDHVELDEHAGEQNGEDEELERLVVEQQELLLHREKVMSLDPQAHIGQTRVEAERGQAAHDHLEHLDAEIGHQITGPIFHYAVDEHHGQEGRKARDEKSNRFVSFCVHTHVIFVVVIVVLVS